MSKIEKLNKFMFEDDAEIRDDYLAEWGKAVQNYIKTGVRREQLEDLLDIKELFQKKYQERFEIKKMIEAAFQSSRDKIKDNNYLKDNIKYGSENISQELMTQFEDIYLQALFATVEKTLFSNFDKALKDAAYLSHANMLYELYEQEERIRREEREFKEMSEKFQNLADIMQQISKQRRMELRQIEQCLNLSEQELSELLQDCSEYFNIRQRKDHYIVSLSPEGKRFKDFIFGQKHNYSEETLNQLIYKNCINILEGVKKSYASRVRQDPKLDGMRPENERAVRHKYRETLIEILHHNKGIYPDSIDQFNLWERRGNAYEKYHNKFSWECNEFD